MRNIWDEMWSMQDEMDRMFDGFFRVKRPLLAGPSEKGKALAAVKPFRAPVCDIRETEKSVVATFELPGADKKDIDLRVRKDSIELKAQRNVQKEVKREESGYYSFMSSASQFYRKLPLPARVDENKAVAVYKDGVLQVTMPKIAQIKQDDTGRRISIT